MYSDLLVYVEVNNILLVSYEIASAPFSNIYFSWSCFSCTTMIKKINILYAVYFIPVRLVEYNCKAKFCTHISKLALNPHFGDLLLKLRMYVIVLYEVFVMSYAC